MNLVEILFGWLGSQRKAYFGCLMLFGLAGIWGGRLVGRGLMQQIGPDVLSSRASGPDTGLSSQRNILLIGVDRLSAQKPKIESAWLIMYFPGIPEFTLVPVFPDIDAEAATGTPAMPEGFYLEGSGEPAGLFMERLSGRVPWSNYLVIDESGLAAWLDQLGGVTVGGEQKSGAAVLAAYHTLKDPAQAIIFQTAVLQALCEHASTGIEAKQVRSMLEAAKPGMATDMDLVREIETRLEEMGDFRTVRCQFPLGYSASP